MLPFLLALTAGGLLSGCGAREEAPTKPAPPKEQDYDDEDIKRIITQFKKEVPTCKVPPEITIKDQWSDDNPIATTSAMRDFIWVDRNQWGGLSPKQKESLILHEQGHINGLSHPDGIRRGQQVDDIMQPFGDAKFIEDWDMDSKRKDFYEKLKKVCTKP